MVSKLNKCLSDQWIKTSRDKKEKYKTKTESAGVTDRLFMKEKGKKESTAVLLGQKKTCGALADDRVGKKWVPGGCREGDESPILV